MPTILDDEEAVSRIDSKGMLGAVERLPDLMVTQMESSSSVLGNLRRRLFQNIVLMGMGGSASAADVTLDWLSDKISIPVFVHRDPKIPKFVGSNSLFVALSYSGDTRETIIAFREARRRVAHTVAIGTGGKLRELCDESSVPFLKVQPAPAPRAALGQMIVACADALRAYGVVQDHRSEMHSAVRELRQLNRRIKGSTLQDENPAKKLAYSLKNSVPVIFAFRRMAAVARRFKNQLAENSKMVGKYSLLPEAAHNEIEAWHNQHLPLIPIFIRDRVESKFENSIFQSFRSTIAKANGFTPQQVRLNSHTRLSGLLSPILYLDYVSVYLSLLKKIDPTDTPWIRHYKARV